ncbi:MAG TPA: hypothetical protein VIK14_16720 [Ignavibacteria bacterium]
MRKFALIRIEQVKGKINFFKLEIDGKCEFDELCKQLENRKEKSRLLVIYAIMDSVSNMIRLPGIKFKELTGRSPGDNVKEFEIKKRPYRVYLFKDNNGDIVVFGSAKSRQKRDINRFRAIKYEYLKDKGK